MSAELWASYDSWEDKFWAIADTDNDDDFNSQKENYKVQVLDEISKAESRKIEKMREEKKIDWDETKAIILGDGSGEGSYRPAVWETFAQKKILDANEFLVKSLLPKVGSKKEWGEVMVGEEEQAQIVSSSRYLSWFFYLYLIFFEKK